MTIATDRLDIHLSSPLLIPMPLLPLHLHHHLRRILPAQALYHHRHRLRHHLPTLRPQHRQLIILRTEAVEAIEAVLEATTIVHQTLRHARLTLAMALLTHLRRHHHNLPCLHHHLRI